VNETLVRGGYVGASPETPTIAIAFTALEAFRQFSRVCPRFSAQAYIKGMCHLQMVIIFMTSAALMSCPDVHYLIGPLPSLPCRPIQDNIRRLSGDSPPCRWQNPSCSGTEHSELACPQRLSSVHV
jgi:hypothetical protein